jgi:hypothetical protein
MAIYSDEDADGYIGSSDPDIVEDVSDKSFGSEDEIDKDFKDTPSEKIRENLDPSI